MEVKPIFAGFRKVIQIDLNFLRSGDYVSRQKYIENKYAHGNESKQGRSQITGLSFEFISLDHVGIICSSASVDLNMRLISENFWNFRSWHTPAHHLAIIVAIKQPFIITSQRREAVNRVWWGNMTE